MTNPLAELAEQGQSVWLDAMRRGLIDGGDFERMIERDGLCGVTSNPAIFEKAMAGSRDYDRGLRALVRAGETDAERIYQALAVEDIRRTADVFRAVHDRTDGLDGWVCLEVSPRLARDAAGTVREARRLHAAVDRPNAMIKVPATPEGMPAIEELVAEGIPVNVTLLFARTLYERAAEAYLRGLERRVGQGRSLEGVASVASFFVSRIDEAVDRRVRARLEPDPGPELRRHLEGLVGRVAIANAQLAYARYGELYDGERWAALAARGARPQRLLWASTGTKHAALSDVHYLEGLIGPETVATVPPATYEAFRDHGRVARTLEADLDEARGVLMQLAEAGLDLDAITDELLVEGIEKFEAAYDGLLAAVEGARARAVGA